MIAMTSFALMSFALMSQSILSTNKRIKIAANAIFLGAVFSAFIGLITGTLGFSLGSDESIVGILYVSGFQVKNYCGGIWLLLFVLNYMEPYFAYYPDKLYKNLVETRVIYKDIEEEILLEIKKRDGL